MGQRGDRDMKFIDLMMMEKENLEKTIRLCARQLKHLPRGTLSTQNKSGHIYYTKRVDTKRMYLRNDSPEIQQLKDRHMAELVLDNASHDLELMNQIIQHYKPYDPNELALSLAAAYQGVSKDIILSLGFAYTLGYSHLSQKNAKYKEHLNYVTTSGTKRRSKSELIIDGIYEMLEIQVAYEKPLILSGGYEVNPDYTAWSSLRKRDQYHEHIGDLEDPEKMKKNIWKFRHYVATGIYPLDRVLFTFDKPDGSIDAEEIQTLIKMFMM